MIAVTRETGRLEINEITFSHERVMYFLHTHPPARERKQYCNNYGSRRLLGLRII